VGQERENDECVGCDGYISDGARCAAAIRSAVGPGGAAEATHLGLEPGWRSWQRRVGPGWRYPICFRAGRMQNSAPPPDRQFLAADPGTMVVCDDGQNTSLRIVDIALPAHLLYP
jgi:hypothetical protein